ncbi:MAG: universal stress protein [bacterium]|nr:universal stress protein [bacterium]
MLKRILVALSGTPFTPVAVKHAVELARRYDAVVTGVTLIDLKRIHVVGAVPVGGGAAAQALRGHRTDLIRQRIEEEIERFESVCKEAGVHYQLAHETEDTFTKLCDLWRYHDLTMIGLRGLFEYEVIKNPDDMVARLINRRVRPILAVAEDYRPIRRALVAYNGSMGSAKAMKRFVRMGLWPDAKVKIVVFNRDDEAEQLLSDAADYYHVYGYDDVETAHVRCASPREELLKQAAAWESDILVMGTQSKMHLLKHVLGSMTTQALRHAEIPLFLTQ